MKVNAPQTGRQPLRTIQYGDIFFYDGTHFLKVNPTLHLKNDPTVTWSVRLEDGVLTQFGTETLVRLVTGEFEVKP